MKCGRRGGRGRAEIRDEGLEEGTRGGWGCEGVDGEGGGRWGEGGGYCMAIFISSILLRLNTLLT